MKKTIIAGIAGSVLILGVWWVLRYANRSVTAPPAAPAPPTTAQPVPQPAPPEPAIDTAAVRPEAVPSLPPAAPMDREQMKAAVTTALGELKQIYDDVGELSWDDAKALIAKRKERVNDLINRLADLGPGGAQAIADVYTGHLPPREKLTLVAALAKINDSEAATVLADILNRETTFSVQKEVVAALGSRKEDTAETVLTGTLKTQTDSRLRFSAAQALSGRAGALDNLADTIRSDADQNVRLEAIRSVGLVGDAAAQSTLAGFASDSSAELILRQTAIKELGRSFGESALPTLTSLLADPNEAVRLSVVKTVARVKTDAATALLQRAATTDASETVRETAAAILAAGQTAANTATESPSQ